MLFAYSITSDRLRKQLYRIWYINCILAEGCLFKCTFSLITTIFFFAVIIGCSTGICSVQFALLSYAGVRNAMGNYMKVKLRECMNDSRSTPLNSRKFCKTFCLVEKSFAFFSLKILFQKNYLGFKLLFTQGNFQEAVVECSVKTAS